MFVGGGGDVRPNCKDEKYGRGYRAQNHGVLRNVGGGKEGSGRVLTTLTVFFSFFFLISIINCFYWGHGTTVLNPTVLGTTDFQPSMGHVVQNLQLQSIPPPPS